jgi:hypothetical protein
VVALGVAAACFPGVLFGGELLASPSYLDKTLAVWEALRSQGSSYLPGALGGHDFGAAPDIAHGSPAHALWWLLSSVIDSARSFSVLRPLLLALAAWCTWGHLRTLGLGQRGAVLGALVVGGNELMFETLGTIGVPGTVAAVPAVAWTGERLARSPGPGRLALVAVAVGAALVGGHQQYAIFGLAYALGLTALRLVQLQGPRGLAWAGAAALLGAALSAAVLVPAVHLLAETSRAAVGLGELLAEDGIFLDGPMLRGLVSLDPGLRQGDAVELDPVYVGAVPVLLGVLGLLSRRRGLAVFGGTLGAAVLLLSHPATGLLEALLGAGLPGLSLFKTAEGRLLLLFFALGLLGALGVDRLEARLGARRWGPRVGWGVVGLAALGLVRMRVSLEQEVFAEHRVTGAQLSALRQPAPWFPGPDRRYYLHRDRSEDELENTALLWGGQELSGRAVLPPRRWLLFMHGQAGVPALEQRPPERPEQGFLAHVGLVGVSGVDTVVLPARLDRAPAGEGWVRREHGRRVVYQRDPQPLVLHSARARPVDSVEQALAALRERAEERGPVLVESTDPVPEESPGGAAVRMVESGPARVVVETDGPAGWVVLRRPWSAGWTAAVDGQDQALLPADVLSQAVWVDGGRHTVVYVHQSPGRGLGRGLTGLAWVVCGVLVVLGRRERNSGIGHGLKT